MGEVEKYYDCFGVQWPTKLRSYMDNLSALGDVPLYDEMAL